MRAKIGKHSSHTPDLVSQPCETQSPIYKEFLGLFIWLKYPNFMTKYLLNDPSAFTRSLKIVSISSKTTENMKENTSTHFESLYQSFGIFTTHLTEMSPCINPLVYLISAFFSACTKYFNIRFEVKIQRLLFLDCFIGFTIYNDHLSMQKVKFSC